MYVNPSPAPPRPDIRAVYAFIRAQPDCRHSIRDVYEHFVGTRILQATNLEFHRLARMTRDARVHIVKAQRGV
jgi:hypothetical protein